MPLFGPPNIPELKSKRNVKGLIKALTYKKTHIRTGAVRALIDVLSEGVDLVATIRILGECGHKEATEPLIYVLDYTHFCLEAVKALGRLGGEAAIEAVLSALGDEHEPVRQAAVEVLRREGIANIDQLIVVIEEALADHPEMLLQLRDNRAIRPLIHALCIEGTYISSRRRKAAGTALRLLGDKTAINLFIHNLTNAHSNETVRLVAVNALGELGAKEALQPLIASLNDGSAKVSEAAARALGKLGDKKALRPLLNVLEHAKHKYLRKVAAEALGSLGDIEVIDPLIAVLYDREVGETAAYTLGRLGDKRATKPLIALLGNDHVEYETREASVRALGWLGDVEAVDPLIAILEQSEMERQRSNAEMIAAWKQREMERQRSNARNSKSLKEFDRGSLTFTLLHYRSLGGGVGLCVCALKSLMQIGQPALASLTRLIDEEKMFIMVLALGAWLIDNESKEVRVATLGAFPFLNKKVSAKETYLFLDILRGRYERYRQTNPQEPFHTVALDTKTEKAAETAVNILALVLDFSILPQLKKKRDELLDLCKSQDTSDGGTTYGQIYGRFIEAVDQMLAVKSGLDTESQS